MNFLKSVHCRYQKHSSWWWLHGKRLSNKARWRAFTLLLSLYPSTTQHTFSKTIIFKHTIQPSSLIGRYAIGFHSFPSYNSLLVSEDRHRWKDAIASNHKKIKGVSFISVWMREEWIYFSSSWTKKDHFSPLSEWTHMFPFIHIYVCTSHISATPG